MSELTEIYIDPTLPANGSGDSVNPFCDLEYTLEHVAKQSGDDGDIIEVKQ